MSVSMKSAVSRRTTFLASSLLLCLPIPALAQIPAPSAPNGASTNGSVLQQHYLAAQQAQAAHDPDTAGHQYRIFLADALDELGIAWAQAGDYHKAANDFDEALHLAPNSPAMEIEYGQAAFQAGDLEHAKLLANDVLDKYSSNGRAAARAHLLLGRILLRQNHSAEAKTQLEQAVALDSNFINGYELAVACLNLEDQKCASQLFSEMAQSFGDKAILHLYFGQAYLNSDFQSQAVAEFKQALALDDKLPGAHYSLAAAYLATGQNTADAEPEIRKEIAVSPSSGTAYAALGHLEAGQHHDAQAEADLKKAIALDPSGADAYFYLGQLFADLHRNAEAESALRNCIRLTTDDSQNHQQLQKAHYLLGRLLLQSGDSAAGQKELQISESLMKQNLSRDREKLADFYAQDSGMGQSTALPSTQTAEQASRENQQALKDAAAFEKQIGPPIADSYNNLGAIAGSQSQFAPALIYFQRAAEWNPSMPGLDENWGRAAFASGQFDQAIVPLSRYLKAHPSDLGMRSALAISQFGLGDYSAAAATLRPVADDPSLSSEAQFVYAQSLIHAGDLTGGLARLTALEKKLPDNGDLHRALAEAYQKASRPQDAAREMAQYKSLAAASSHPQP